MAWEERNGESELEQKLLTPANRDNDIKMDVVAVPGRGLCHSM